MRDDQVAGRELVSFFALTLVSSWLYVFLAGPYVSAGIGGDAATEWFRARAVVIIWAPMSAALLTVMVSRGAAGLWSLLARFDPRGVKVHWWAVALLLPIAIHSVPIVLSGIDGRGLIDLAVAWASAFSFLFFMFVGEELGWRGYALPALQSRFTPFVASMVLGVLWAAWHFPVWFGIGFGSSGVATGVIVVLVSTVGIVAMALVLTWLANRTGACVVLAMLYHGSNNAALRVYGSGDSTAPFLASTAIVIFVALVVVVADRKRFFSMLEAAGPVR